RDDAWLRTSKSLTSLNDKQPADFWKQADANRKKFDAWAAGVAKMVPAKQVEAVAAKLRETNRSFVEQVNPTVANDIVVAVQITTDNLTDISPVRAFPGLERLDCYGSGNNLGQLWDLGPLQGLKLNSLQCHNNKIADLSPLAGMPLTI